jgi:hypothetical protein
MLTANRLRKVLSYTPSTGIFRWKVSVSSRAPVGAIAGAKNGGVTVKFVSVVGLIQQVA